MSGIKHRFKKAEGNGTGTFSASSDRDPPPGDTGGGYSPPLSRISSFSSRDKNPVHRIVSPWDGEHCSPPVHFYYPCETNAFNNDIFVSSLSIDAPSTVSPVQNYTHHKCDSSTCVFMIRHSNIEKQLDCPIDDREHLAKTLFTVVIAGQESGYNSNSCESDPPGDSPLTGNPPSNLPNLRSSGSSFYQNEEACVSSYSSKFSPMDCPSSNSYADD
jgi:hypothetical protein